MRVVVDTNVFISGVFFTGPPYEILNAWRQRKVEFVLSPPILDEYQTISTGKTPRRIPPQQLPVEPATPLQRLDRRVTLS